MKIWFFILYLSMNAFSMEIPKDFGVEKSASYYENILSQQDSPISVRGASMIASCREELKSSNNEQRCVKFNKLTFPCTDEMNISSGKIEFCVQKGESLLTINKKFTINYYFKRRNKDLKLQLHLKKMFSSAVTCMKTFYKKAGIDLNLTLTEVPYESHSDITIQEQSLTGAYYHSIPLGGARGYYSHRELCQIVTHEFSHHFGLPDRYQMYNDQGQACFKQSIYPPETLMAMHGKEGFIGYPSLKFHEHDIADMLYYVCPKTVRYYEKNKEMTCSENYDYLNKEGFYGLLDSLKDIIYKYKKLN